MKKTYKIEVDCANCALKMEEAAKKVEGVLAAPSFQAAMNDRPAGVVLAATVSFMTQKMKVEFTEAADEKAVMQSVLKACKKVESDCEIFLD